MHGSLRVIILLVFSVPACAQWVELESNTTSNLHGISAPATYFAVAVGENSTILRTMDYGATWTPLNGEPGIDYYAVSFPTAPFGLAAGSSGTILFTNSGGEFWETIETGWMHPYYAAHQPTPLLGIVGGRNSIFQPLIGRSSNGWQTHDFIAFYPYYNDSYHEGAITDLFVFTADSAVATFQMTDGDGVICFTAEAGTGNWITQYIRSQPFYAVDFWGDQLAVAVGAGGQIMATTNGGWYWSIPASPTTETLNDVCFGSANLVWAVGDAGTIIHSADGGDTWETQESPVDVNLHAVSFAGADTGYAVGSNGVIIFTANGGMVFNQAPGEFARVFPDDSSQQIGQLPILVNWTSSVDPDGDAVTYILRIWSADHPQWQDSTFILPDTARVVHIPPPPHYDDLYTMHWTVQATDGIDTVMATNETGTFFVYLEVSADDPGSALPREFALSAYPNPFNPTTTMSLSLPVATGVVLNVYDVTGRLAREERFGYMAAGIHAIPFDGASLPSGIYLATLEAANTRLTQKLVLMK